MANKLHVNLASDLLFRPKDLKKAHDDAVTRVQKEADRIEAERIVSHFPAVNEVLPMLGKYEFVGNAYAVLVPKEVKDIVAEGYALHHCVRTSDRYFDRIARKESFIGFVRRADALDTPYYTLEFEPGGTIRQGDQEVLNGSMAEGHQKEHGPLGKRAGRGCKAGPDPGVCRTAKDERPHLAWKARRAVPCRCSGEGSHYCRRVKVGK